MCFGYVGVGYVNFFFHFPHTKGWNCAWEGLFFWKSIASRECNSDMFCFIFATVSRGLWVICYDRLILSRSLPSPSRGRQRQANRMIDMRSLCFVQYTYKQRVTASFSRVPLSRWRLGGGRNSSVIHAGTCRNWDCTFSHTSVFLFLGFTICWDYGRNHAWLLRVWPTKATLQRAGVYV